MNKSLHANKSNNFRQKFELGDETNAHQPLNTTNFAQNLDKTGCSNGEPGCCGDWDSCPSHPNCECNKLGSSKRSCDLLTGTCYCLPGVTGERCDRCKSGYWGLHGNLVEKEGCKRKTRH